MKKIESFLFISHIPSSKDTTQKIVHLLKGRQEWEEQKKKRSSELKGLARDKAKSDNYAQTELMKH